MNQETGNIAGIVPRKRPKITTGTTHKVVTGCGNLYITINSDEQGVLELFIHLGKSGQCGAAQSEAICRVISAGLRSGVDPRVYIKQLIGIRCPSTSIDDGILIRSCADAIAYALSKSYTAEQLADFNVPSRLPADKEQGMLVFEQGEKR